MNSEQLITEIGDYFSSVADYLTTLGPKLILGLVVLIVGYFTAHLVRFVVTRLIGYMDKVLNDRLKGRLLHVNLSGSKVFVGKAIYWIIIFFFVTLFTEIVGLPVVTSWLREMGIYLPNLIAGIVIIFLGIIFGRLASDLLRKSSTQTGIGYAPAMGKAVQYIILVISIIIAVNQLGIDITFLTYLIYIILGTLLFGAALAFGMGARTSVSNILASYYVYKMYVEGNVIKIGEHQGRIVKITTTAVHLETEKGQVCIPAKEFSEKDSVLIDKG